MMSDILIPSLAHHCSNIVYSKLSVVYTQCEKQRLKSVLEALVMHVRVTMVTMEETPAGHNIIF